MFERIKLKFGSAATEEPLDLSVTPITVFVGPNNSGKSKILKEILHFCREGNLDARGVIIEEAVLKNIEEQKFYDKLSHLEKEPNENESLPEGNMIVGNYQERIQIRKEDLTRSIGQVNTGHFRQWFCQWFLRFNTLLLDGQGRMQLAREQQGGNLQSPPHNSLSALFRDDEKRAEVRRIVHDAFGLHFVIDPTDLGKLKVRLSEEAPSNEMQERGVHADAVEFHSKARKIDELSDGVKAFTGIVLELVAGDPMVLMVDEPEAFLHPSLSYKLGKEVSVTASAQSKNIFVSTHSSNFIMGCVQSGVPINIVRLTYSQGAATARLLPDEKLLQLMRNPLLRSTGVIDGLFYEAVIVTESDADRAFYQEINERLLRHSPERGISNCLFINAQNKQTVHQIIKPLRELGIPAVAIVDIDILKEGGQVWGNFLSSGFVPQISQTPLGSIRQAIKQKFIELSIDMKRDGGISSLPHDEKEAAENLLNQLREYGLFVVPNGELECWLKNLDASGHGPKWLVEVFEKMGENPDLDDYVKPETGDVWDFIANIKGWATAVNRKGIPAKI
ncbi:ATP-dependent nuclease [Photobacterium damselae]|uniref:ATP-dependent nuclease n=1 Tax=Photobacterium damselae TaxID=38293 RepID=UPI001F35D58B|nr:AAA family ATPase [Photobacterium damselae]UKA03070.1 ATP-binding protein [Photobacterium damselae subsp. damselae]